MRLLFAVLAIVTGLPGGIVCADSSGNVIEVVDLTKELEDASYYHRDNVMKESIGSKIIGGNGWAWAIQSLKHTRKIRAQLVLERGKIVHEYYRPPGDVTDDPKDAPGHDVDEHVHSITKSFSAMIIAHMIENGYDIAYSDTLEKIFENDKSWTWDEVQIHKSQIPEKAEYNVKQLKKATLHNILAMSAGFDRTRFDLSFPLSDSLLSQYLEELKNINQILYLIYASDELWPTREEWINRSSGGENIVEALAFYDMHPDRVAKDQTSYGEFSYVPFSPLLSYIIKLKSNLTPSQYLETYFTRHLGLGKPWSNNNEGNGNWGWRTNADGMEYGWSGMNITARALGKFGQLILQGGTNGDGEQILSKDWTDQITTPGGVRVSARNQTYIHHFWKYFDPIPPSDWTGEYTCMDGEYGHLTCIQPSTQRVYVQLVEDDPESLHTAQLPSFRGYNERRFFELELFHENLFGAPERTKSSKADKPKRSKISKAKSKK